MINNSITVCQDKSTLTDERKNHVVFHSIGTARRSRSTRTLVFSRMEQRNKYFYYQ